MLGIVNGVVRELAYKDRVGERSANRISAVTLIALLACYFNALDRRWPIPTKREAVEIGGLWVVLTVLFEFGFGHYVDRKSWSDLVDNYDVSEGNLWPLVLLWIGSASSDPALLRQPLVVDPRARRGARQAVRQLGCDT